LISEKVPIKGFFIDLAGIVSVWRWNWRGVISLKSVPKGVVGVLVLGNVVFGTIIEGVSLVDFIRILLWFVVGH
jgi:hypothetical protein